ncbi:hypothetical protein BKA59DRAFT_452461 [Fusarium tricinctum]|uniref:Uncharacterized protein n=1 Tax=Fusarium tricinctum TaxID=61284 RepID=A0A8K0S013_9HYPO|nr:hypothetical protein BKA59DRAFT_452461 [Fusarium tricinctum]
MKLALPTMVFSLSLLGAVDASRIELDVTTGPGIIPVYSSSYYDDKGKYYALGAFNDGCRKTEYDWIKQICIDSGKERAHVIYSGGSRNCYKVTKHTSKLCGGFSGCWGGVCNRCWNYVYSKTACTWKRADGADDTQTPTGEQEST